MEKDKKLADEHWAYIRGLLEIHHVTNCGTIAISVKDFINIIGFHYKSAMIHGYKHAMQDLSQCGNVKIPILEISKRFSSEGKINPVKPNYEVGDDGEG